MKEYGKRVWIFPDAELPPEGVNVIPGHESIILTNVTDETANVTITLLYEDREPVSFPVTVGARRVRCLRTNRASDFGEHTAVIGEQYAIVPRIGDVKLTALTTLQIQKFYNETKAHGRVQRYENMDDLSLSNKTIRGLHTMLRQCLEQAVTERLIPYNPANGCRLPKKEKKKMQIIPPEKIQDYLKAAEECGVLPMFYLELSTGLRRGELVALLWSDLNLQTKTLTVSKSVSRGKGELVVTEPKTENSVREIYLSDEAIRLLVEDRKNHPFSPYMFPSPKTGGMYGPDCVGRIHKKLLEKAGIEEHVRFHEGKHS